MNTGACDCCTPNPFDYFVRKNAPYNFFPYIKTRYREIERRKCAIFVDGTHYTETETGAYCSLDPDQRSTLKKIESKLERYSDPNVAFGPFCNFQDEFIPPISSWTGPCGPGVIGSRVVLEEEVGTGDVVTDEDLKGDVLKILRNASYSEWSLSTSSTFAYGTYTNIGFAEENQYRIFHLPSPSCYLKVWISIATYEGNDGLGGKIDEFDEIYEWKPTSNQCLPDTTKSAIADEQIIESEIYTISPSGTNVATFASFKKFSFLPNYEPDDPIVVSPFQYERPTPDFNTDGIPQFYQS